MRSYLASVILGIAVGVVYGLVKVRSPAPPAIALLGHLFKSDVQLSASRNRGEVAVADNVRQ
jgi:XapX domain-containing protein